MEEPMGKPLNLTEEAFDAEVLNYKGVVVMDVYADWCGPCRVIAPVMDRLAERGDVKVVKVNLEQNQSLCRQLGVTALPTILYYRDGKLAHKDEGVLPEQAIIDRIALT